jgi:hypothetical protein
MPSGFTTNNDGKTSLNRIAALLGEAFGIDLTHFSRDFYDMRIRNDRTPFIDRLLAGLKWRMDNPKRLWIIVCLSTILIIVVPCVGCDNTTEVIQSVLRFETALLLWLNIQPQN